jgi:hypothetical protein
VLAIVHEPTRRNIPEEVNSAVPLWELQIGRQLHFITTDDILTICKSIVKYSITVVYRKTDYVWDYVNLLIKN